MTRFFLLVFLLFLLAGTSSAQTKLKPVSKAPPSAVQKLLAGSDLPFNMVNDSLAVIPYEGENIKSYQVVVQKASDLIIVYSSLTEAVPGKISEAQYKYLLLQNDHYDIVKTGLSADSNVFI